MAQSILVVRVIDDVPMFKMVVSPTDSARMTLWKSPPISWRALSTGTTLGLALGKSLFQQMENSRMAKYKIVINVDGSRIDMVKKQCVAAFGVDVSAQVTKIERQPSRTDRLSEAESWVSDAKSVVEDLRSEMQDWKDNIPESLQSGPKGDEIDECIGELEEIEGALDGVNFSVSFPSMM